MAFICERRQFALGLASYDNRPYRDRIIERIIHEASQRGCQVTHLVLPPRETQLLAKLQQHLLDNPSKPPLPLGEGRGEGNDASFSRAVMVTGIEESLYGEPADATRKAPPILGNANMQREAFVDQCPVPIVLWLMPAADALMAQTAPDFWHWRAGAFDFTSDESDRRARETELTRVHYDQLRSLPRQQQAENITVLRDLLQQAEFADDADSSRGLRRRLELLNQIGAAYHAQGDLAQAQPCTKQALALAQQIAEADHIPDHPLLAMPSNNLGRVLQDLGDLDGARHHIERALRIHEKVHGRKHPNLATVVANLGSVLQDMGDLAGARHHLKRALRIDEKVYGPEHPRVAISLSNLGRVLQDLGDLAGARHHIERALRIGEKVYVQDQPELAILVSNLGGVLRDLGDLAGARQHFERALQIVEKAHGPEHPNVPIDIWNIGDVLQKLGDFAGAKQHLERALAIFRKVYGDGHRHTQAVMQQLASLSQ